MKFLLDIKHTCSTFKLYKGLSAVFNLSQAFFVFLLHGKNFGDVYVWQCKQRSSNHNVVMPIALDSNFKKRILNGVLMYPITDSLFWYLVNNSSIVLLQRIVEGKFASFHFWRLYEEWGWSWQNNYVYA